jgi:hypothetical protein
VARASEDGSAEAGDGPAHGSLLVGGCSMATCRARSGRPSGPQAVGSCRSVIVSAWRWTIVQAPRSRRKSIVTRRICGRRSVCPAWRSFERSIATVYLVRFNLAAIADPVATPRNPRWLDDCVVVATPRVGRDLLGRDGTGRHGRHHAERERIELVDSIEPTCATPSSEYPRRGPGTTNWIPRETGSGVLPRCARITRGRSAPFTR